MSCVEEPSSERLKCVASEACRETDFSRRGVGWRDSVNAFLDDARGLPRLRSSMACVTLVLWNVCPDASVPELEMELEVSSLEELEHTIDFLFCRSSSLAASGKMDQLSSVLKKFTRYLCCMSLTFLSCFLRSVLPHIVDQFGVNAEHAVGIFPFEALNTNDANGLFSIVLTLDTIDGVVQSKADGTTRRARAGNKNSSLMLPVNPSTSYVIDVLLPLVNLMLADSVLLRRLLYMRPFGGRTRAVGVAHDGEASSNSPGEA
jgi:hypothetical protein